MLNPAGAGQREDRIVKHLLRRAAVLAAGFMLTGAAAAQTVSISTLPPGSINNVQTQAIAKVVQDVTGIQMRVVGFNSPAASMTAVEVGEAQFSFMSNDEVGIAVRGKDEHSDEPLANLRLVTTVFPFKVGIVVRKDSGIETVADLKGKRFPIGWEGFPQGVALSRAMLATAGLDFDDVDGVPTTNLLRAAEDLASGALDATVFAVGAPKMAELDASFGIRFLSLPDTPEARAAMAAIRPEYGIAAQKALPTLNGVADGTNLMQYAMTVVTHANESEDLIYTVAKTLYENKAGLVAGHPSFNAMTPADLAVIQQDVQYHPGAIKFYKEVGIWKGQ
jgi:TRAP transporter TAXI family solute receptor